MGTFLEKFSLIALSIAATSTLLTMPKKRQGSDRPGPVTTDPRFSVIHTDPRFARPKRKDVKIPIDARFKAVFKDKEFIDQRTIFSLPLLIASERGPIWQEAA